MKIKFLILPLLLLASCGNQADKIVPYGIDHSTNWNDNYYTIFDSELKSRTLIPVALTGEEVFRRYNDPNFIALEPDASSLKYAIDYDESVSFSLKHRLAKYNPKLKEGFVSKLFDGQLFCHGNYELARVQIKQEGFSSSLCGTLNKANYFYLNFKCALDFKSQEVRDHLSEITLNIHLYGEKNYCFSYQLNSLPTNFGEATNAYTFFGFDLSKYDIKGTTDFAITYHLDKDNYNNSHGTNYQHALLLYEMGFGNPIF